MKRLTIMLLLIPVAAALLSCSASEDNGTAENAEIVYTSVSVCWFDRFADTLEKLEERSTVIARVTVLEGPRETRIGDAGTAVGYTITPVTIDILYKGDGKVTEGSTCVIREYYVKAYKQEQPGKVFITTYECYLPMIPKEQYILFLVPANEAGDYTTCSLYMGKYVYNETILSAFQVADLSEEELQILSDGIDCRIYWEVAQRVKDKYMR